MIAVVNFASADNIQGINIDFVNIGNAGNAGNTLVMYDGTTGYGAVGYNYRIGKYEVTNAQWNAFTAAVGAPTGNDGGYNVSAFYTGAQQPANKVSWYEAAQFCNYLTSGDKSKGAYQFSGNNTNPGSFLSIDRISSISTYGTTYVIPTQDEWYKAAYFKPDGSGYSRYANGLNTIPAADNGWNYSGGSYNIPWNVGIGTIEQNGTYDMMGNVWEWNEMVDGSGRRLNGGAYWQSYDMLDWSNVSVSSPISQINCLGFRVASVPEPASALIMTLGSLFFALKRRKR
jgi:hypothetical protein